MATIAVGTLGAFRKLAYVPLGRITPVAEIWGCLGSTNESELSQKFGFPESALLRQIKLARRA